jgi:hypothetical protein
VTDLPDGPVAISKLELETGVANAEMIFHLLKVGGWVGKADYTSDILFMA